MISVHSFQNFLGNYKYPCQMFHHTIQNGSRDENQRYLFIPIRGRTSSAQLAFSARRGWSVLRNAFVFPGLFFLHVSTVFARRIVGRLNRAQGPAKSDRHIGVIVFVRRSTCEEDRHNRREHNKGSFSQRGERLCSK